MTTPSNTQIEGLLERLRQATGPDRELDCRLSHHFDRKGIYYGTGDDSGWAPAPTVDGWDDAKWREVGQDHVSGLIPRFTASIDAALALVEGVLPRWEIALGTCGQNNCPWACLTEPRDPFRDFAADAPTMELAIIEALLSALSSLKDTSS